jgi:uncharacterized alkaline shock family protein YloU
MADKRVEIIDEDGRITIAEDVIASIARAAAEQVDGIARSVGGGSGGLMSIFGGEDVAPSIKTDLVGDQVRIELRISVEYGYPVHEVAGGVQRNVQQDVEKYAGVTVTNVDVYVKKVVPPHTHESEEE